MKVWIKRNDKDGDDVVSAMVVFEVDNGKKYRILRKDQNGKVRDWFDVEKDKVRMIADDDMDSENEEKRKLSNERRGIVNELNELGVKIRDDIIKDCERRERGLFKEMKYNEGRGGR